MSYAAAKPRAVCDIECYINFFCINFKDIITGRSKSFEFYDGHPLDRAGVIRVMRNFTLVTFNGNTYDVPMLRAALKMGATNADLKKISDAIIQRNLKPWDAEREFNLSVIDWLDHIDLIEPAPSVQVGLKLYGGRLHSKRLQDLPIEPDAIILPEQRPVLVDYCWNDCDTTIDLYKHIEPQINLRCEMSDQYGIDLRSKSDAQIAEAVIRHELERIKGDKIYRPELPYDYTFQYEPPSFLRFKTAQMREAFDVVCNAVFKLKHTAAKSTDDDAVSVGGVKVKVSGIEMPKEIKGLKINMGRSIYRMGIGGLHSSEVSVAHYSDEDVVIIDNDVASYYPAILLVCELYPDHLGRDFLDVYRSIRERRIAAKRAKDKVTDMTLKIVLNGTFGKLGSKWSFLYSPNLMIQVTMTGQLALLMLIEELELAGIPVISANTDGVTSKCPRDRIEEMLGIIKGWERRTGFDMEPVVYKWLASQSVNSYLADKAKFDEEPDIYRTLLPDWSDEKLRGEYRGGVKQKGLFAFVGSKGSPAEKNPAAYVCIDAVINYLTKGTPLEETIEWCPDIRRFLTVRRVTGGALFDGEYLGKVCRWYYARGSKSHIAYAKNGNKVAKSDGAKPMMELTGLPDDIDYQWYVRECRKMLGELGVL